MTVHRTWWKTAIGVTLTVVMLFPVYWMINVSLTQRDAIRAGDFYPKSFTLDHYRVAIHQQLPFLATSLVISIATVLLTLLIAAPAGYALSRLYVPGRGTLNF